MSKPKPWEQQEKESPQAFRAFSIYREMDPVTRSLTSTARIYHNNPVGQCSGQIRDWAAKWEWRQRALAWDMEMDRVVRNSQIKAVKDAAERHLIIVRGLQNKAVERLASIHPKRLSPGDVLRYLAEAIKLERLILGEPTEVAKQVQVLEEDMSFLSDGELLLAIENSRKQRIALDRLQKVSEMQTNESVVDTMAGETPAAVSVPPSPPEPESEPDTPDEPIITEPSEPPGDTPDAEPESGEYV